MLATRVGVILVVMVAEVRTNNQDDSMKKKEMMALSSLYLAIKYKTSNYL